MANVPFIVRRFASPKNHSFSQATAPLLERLTNNAGLCRRRPVENRFAFTGIRPFTCTSSPLQQATVPVTNIGRALSTMPNPSPTFKAMEVNFDGEIKKVSMHTPDVLKAAGIYARDLFTLNLTSRQESKIVDIRRTMAAIIPRKRNIILAFGIHRAVVTLDRVFLFDAHMPAVVDFAKEISEKFKIYKEHFSNEPRELVFLEEVLHDTAEAYSRRLRLYEPIVDNFLDKVANEVYSDTGVHLLVPLKDSLQSFELQVKQTVDCISSLLHDDEEMLALLITEQDKARKEGLSVDFSRHEHVELLLGVYGRQFSNIAMEISYLLGRLQSKQEFVSLALAGYRNRLIRVNVHLGIAGLSLAFCTTIAGFFGMNLISGLEDSAIAFYSVVTGSVLGGVAISLSSINYLSGPIMQKQAEQRLGEIETLTGALSDMCALDYVIKAVKKTVREGETVDKEEFRRLLRSARWSKKANMNEVDLLFEVFDKYDQNGNLTIEDFEALDSTGRMK